MIEIGNVPYGNSQGRYAFPDRHLADSRSWTDLLDAVHADEYGNLLRVGWDNDNIVRNVYSNFAFHMSDGTTLFEIFPYYWGEDVKLQERHNFVY